jgi:hypothetical protein
MEDDITEVKAVDADDPNADLIGYEFSTQDFPHITWRVTGTPNWSDGNYVVIESDQIDAPVITCRPAGLVRSRMLAEADAELIGHAQDAKDALDADS